jgi:hypothetical protein
MPMDPTIWSSLPFDILQMVFIWLPLSVLTKFRIVSKRWKDVLESQTFLSQCNQISMNEFGFLSPLFHDRKNYFLGEYLNQDGRISRFLVPFIDSRYRVECTAGSMVLLSFPTQYSHCNNYFVMNPFTKAFKNIGCISVGYGGFFSLLQNVTANKYDWVVLKHVYKRMQSKYYICSSLDRVWRRTELPYGGTTPPKDAVFYKNKLFWLYLDKDYEEYPHYGYTIYWFDVFKNEWGFSFVSITDIQCMSLALYNNQLICLINDGSTSVWAIEEVENFQFGQACSEPRLDYFEDDWGFKWTLLEEISTDINKKCPGYLPFRALHGTILMCNYNNIPFMFYNLITRLCIPIAIDNVSNEQSYGFNFPTVENFNDLIESGYVFPLIPNMDSMDDIPTLGIDMM